MYKNIADIFTKKPVTPWSRTRFAVADWSLHYWETMRLTIDIVLVVEVNLRLKERLYGVYDCGLCFFGCDSSLGLLNNQVRSLSLLISLHATRFLDWIQVPEVETQIKFMGLWQPPKRYRLFKTENPQKY